MDDTKKSNATLVLAILLGMSGLLNICIYGKLHQQELQVKKYELVADYLCEDMAEALGYGNIGTVCKDFFEEVKEMPLEELERNLGK